MVVHVMRKHIYETKKYFSNYDYEKNNLLNIKNCLYLNYEYINWEIKIVLFVI